MTEAIDPPSEIEQVADILGKQRPELPDLYRFASVQATIDDDKACGIGTCIEREHESLTVQTVTGEMLEIR